ncbi:MAG TPA: NADP-dependent oxidoreductase [Kofleriaceae bacterium]|jgi:NADPH:quinone reductase-like Zn-dependent oxidoreductase
MKAAVLVAFGGVDQLEIRDMPEPKLGPGEVKIRNVATSINPIDWKLREGAKRPGMTLELPAILGRDAAGVVIEVGAGVTRIRVGAKVAGPVTGGYAERVVANEVAWAEVPDSMDLADAAAAPTAALTGAELGDAAIRARPGDLVLVTGALGSVGRTAVYAAKARGAHVWAGVRSSQKTAAAALAVEGIVALDDERVLDQLPMLDSIADTVGAATTQKLLDKVRRGGCVATALDEPAGARERGIEVRKVWTRPDAERLAALLRAIAAGTLVIPIAKRFPLDRIREAQQLAQHGAGGKVVVEI